MTLVFKLECLGVTHDLEVPRQGITEVLQDHPTEIHFMCMLHIRGFMEFRYIDTSGSKSILNRCMNPLD